MDIKFRYLGKIITGFALVSLVLGVTFIQQGYAKEAFLREVMAQEQITVGDLEGVVDTAAEAQIAGDTVREHRHGIAPTYGDLLGDGRFDPTVPMQLTYAQALNLENYLYLAVASFGVFTVVKVVGGFMIVMGLALGTMGFALLRKGKS
ncbi:hypothetical protein ACFLUJ_01535 [Chloroflexota bacterium]